MSVRSGLTLVGAIVGGIYGGPQGAQIGAAIGGAIGGVVDPQVIRTPSIGDVAAQKVGEGVPIPQYDGTAGGAGVLVYCSEPRVVVVEEEQGKGTGAVVESERIYLTFTIMIGQSLQDGPGIRLGVPYLLRIWQDDKLVYDITPESEILAESAEFAETFSFYTGTLDQLPDPDVEAIEGAGNVPAYPGRAHIVLKNFDATQLGGSPPRYRFEVGGSQPPEYSSWAIAYNNVYVIPSPDGLDWSGDLSTDFAPIAAGYLIPGNGRLVAYNGGRSAVTLDNGQTWALSAVSALGNSGGSRFGCYYPHNQKFYVAGGGTTGCYESPDGQAWTPRDPGKFSAAIGCSATLLISMQGGAAPTTIRTSVDGQTWANGTDPPVFPDANGSRFCSNGTRILLAGRSGPSACTMLTTTTNGNSWTPNQTPFAVLDTRASACCFDDVNEMWIVGAETGEIAYSPTGDSGWVLSATNIGARINDIQAADGLAVLVADGGQVWTSQNGGATWTRRDPTQAGTVPIVAVAALPPAVQPVQAVATSYARVVKAIGRRCRMPDSEWNLPGLDAVSVRGFVVASQAYTGADAINGLRFTYPSDAAQFDGQIHMFLRGGAVDLELDEQFLVDEDSDLEQEEVLRNGDDRQTASLRLPAKVNLMFPNSTLGYQLTKASSPNFGSESVSEVTIEVPVVLREVDEAPALADVLDKVTRTEALGELVRVFPDDKAGKLVPGSVVRLVDGMLSRRARVTGVRIGEGTRRLGMVMDRARDYSSQASAPASGGWPTPPPSQVGVTDLVVMNLPVLRDQDDLLGVYVAVSGEPGTAWYGARIQYRIQGATTWNTLGELTSRAVMGELVDPLPFSPEAFPDYVNPLVVELKHDDTLETLSVTDWLSELGAWAVVRPDGTGEVVQSRVAVNDTGTIWTLTEHQRGRLATSTAAHLAGARAVKLSGAAFFELPSSVIGRTLEFRAVALDGNAEAATVHELVFNPVSQTEFAPVNLQAQVVGGLLAVSWIPRHRLGTEINPVASDNFRGYRITISDGTVSNTFATTDSSINLAYGYLPGSPSVTVEGINRFGVQGTPATVATGLPAVSALAVENGDFEAGDTGWTADPANLAGTFTITEDNTKALTGDWLAIYAGGAGFGGSRSTFFNDLTALPERFVTFAGSARIPGLTANSPVVVVYPFMEAYDLAGEVILRWRADGIVGRFSISGDTPVTTERTVDLFLYRNQIASIRFGFEVYHASVGTADFEVYLDDFTITADGREL